MAYWEEMDGDNINGKHFESQNTNYIICSFNFPLRECPMRKLSCNMTTPTEETDSDSFNKLIDITDVYTQAECGGN